MTQSNFAIRIQLKDPTTLESDAPKVCATQWEIHWGRIGLAALVFISGAFYGGWFWQNYQSKGPKIRTDATAATLVAPMKPSASTIGSATSELTPPPGTALTGGNQPGSITRTTNTASTPIATAAKTKPYAADSTSSMTDGAVEITDAPVNTPAASDDSALARVEILSPNIGTAVISQTIQNRKPGAPIAHTVSMEGNHLITVYFFTEYKNLKGQWIYHEWFLNHKRVARVRARPHLQQFDAYSSKYIDAHMTGEWEVRVRTERNTLLAKVRFKVVQ